MVKVLLRFSVMSFQPSNRSGIWIQQKWRQVTLHFKFSEVRKTFFLSKS